MTFCRQFSRFSPGLLQTSYVSGLNPLENSGPETQHSALEQSIYNLRFLIYSKWNPDSRPFQLGNLLHFLRECSLPVLTLQIEKITAQ